MQVRPDLAALESLEARVVDEAKEGLEEQSGKDDETDDGVVANDVIGELKERRWLDSATVCWSLDRLPWHLLTRVPP